MEAYRGRDGLRGEEVGENKRVKSGKRAAESEIEKTRCETRRKRMYGKNEQTVVLSGLIKVPK